MTLLPADQYNSTYSEHASNHDLRIAVLSLQCFECTETHSTPSLLSGTDFKPRTLHMKHVQYVTQHLSPMHAESSYLAPE